MQKNNTSTLSTLNAFDPSSWAASSEPSFYRNLSWEEVEPLLNNHVVRRIQRSGVYRFNPVCAQSSLYHGYFD